MHNVLENIFVTTSSYSCQAQVVKNMTCKQQLYTTLRLSRYVFVSASCAINQCKHHQTTVSRHVDQHLQYILAFINGVKKTQKSVIVRQNKRLFSYRGALSFSDCKQMPETGMTHPILCIHKTSLSLSLSLLAQCESFSLIRQSQLSTWAVNNQLTSAPRTQSHHQESFNPLRLCCACA